MSRIRHLRKTRGSQSHRSDASAKRGAHRVDAGRLDGISVPPSSSWRRVVIVRRLHSKEGRTMSFH